MAVEPEEGVQVWVVGHVCRDRILRPGAAAVTQPGGSVLYVALALARLGVRVGVVTKLAALDRSELLTPFAERNVVTVKAFESPATTSFENAYADADLAERTQRLLALADPFTPEEIASLAGAENVHLGPLSAGEITAPVLRAARENASGILSADAQGWLRHVDGEHVSLSRGVLPDLTGVDVLKLDDREARVWWGQQELTASARAFANQGVREILLTRANLGSVLHTLEGAYDIPAFVPRAAVDATGCGDTYLAGYLAARLRGLEAPQAARFAAAAATLKLEQTGPLEASFEDVLARSGE